MKTLKCSDSSSIACCSLEHKKRKEGALKGEEKSEQIIEATSELLRQQEQDREQESRETNVTGHYKSLEIVEGSISSSAQNCDQNFKSPSSEELINNKFETTTVLEKGAERAVTQNDQLEQLHLSNKCQQKQAKSQKNTDDNKSSVVVLPPTYKTIHLDDSLKYSQTGKVSISDGDGNVKEFNPDYFQVYNGPSYNKGANFPADLEGSNNSEVVGSFNKEKGQVKLSSEKVKACSIDSICPRSKQLTNCHNHHDNHRNCVQKSSFVYSHDQNKSLDQSQRHELKYHHHHHQHQRHRHAHHHHGHRHSHKRHHNQSHKRDAHRCHSEDNKTRDLESGLVNLGIHQNLKQQQRQASHSQSRKRSHHKQNCSTNHHPHPHHYHHHHHHHHSNHHPHHREPSTNENSTIELNKKLDEQIERITNTIRGSNVSITLRRASDQKQQQQQENNASRSIDCEQKQPKSSSLSSVAGRGKRQLAKNSLEEDQNHACSVELVEPLYKTENINIHYVNETKTNQKYGEQFDVDKNNNNNESVIQNDEMTLAMLSHHDRHNHHLPQRGKKCNCMTTLTTQPNESKTLTSSKFSSIYHPFCSRCSNNYITAEDDNKGGEVASNSMPQQVVVSGFKRRGEQQSIGIDSLHLSSSSWSSFPKMELDESEKEIEECQLEGLKNYTTSVVSSSLIIAAIPVLPPALVSNELVEVEHDIKRPLDGINVNNSAAIAAASTTNTNNNNNNMKSSYSGQRNEDTDGKRVSVTDGNEYALMTERGYFAREIMADRTCNTNNKEKDVSKELNLSKNATNSKEISTTTTATAALTISPVTLTSPIADTKLASSHENETSKLPLASSTQLNYVSSVENNEPPQMIRYLGSSMQVRSEQKATKVLGVVFFTFVICWTPFFVINFTQAFVERDELAKWISNEIMTTFLWLGYISSTINPVIYTVFNRNFRRAFRQLLLCRRANHGYKFRSRNFELNRSFRMSQYGRQTGNGFNSSMYSAASRQNFNIKSGLIGAQANHHNAFAASDSLRHHINNTNNIINQNNNIVACSGENSGTRDAMLMLDENRVSNKHSHQRSSSSRSTNTKDSNEQSLMEEGLELEQQQQQQAVVNGPTTEITVNNQRDQRDGLVRRLTKQTTLSNPTHQVRGAIRQALKSSSSLFSSFSTSLQRCNDSIQEGRYKGTPAESKELSSSDTRNKDEVLKLIPSNEAVKFAENLIEQPEQQAIGGCIKPNVQRAGIMRSSQQSSVKSTLSQNLQTTKPKLSFVDQTKG